MLTVFLLLLSVSPAWAEIELGPEDALRDRPIVVRAEKARRWRQGSYEVWLLRGDCLIEQGPRAVRGDEAVLWVLRGNPLERTDHRVLAYVEGHVEIDGRDNDGSGNGDRLPPWPDLAGDGERVSLALRDNERPVGESPAANSSWKGDFTSEVPLDIDAGPVGVEPTVKPQILERARAARFPLTARRRVADAEGSDAQEKRSREEVQRAQFEQPGEPAESETELPEELPVVGEPRIRKFSIFRRSATPFQAEIFPDDTRQDGQIIVATSGVNIVIEGASSVEGLGALNSGESGPVDISADRVVAWTQGELDPGGTVQSEDTPFEIYLEGNIIFRQGDRVIYADRMYYDARRKVGTLLAAELLTPLPGYQGLVRLKAQAIQQLAENRFVAQNTFVTTSRLEDPRYRLESGQIEFQDEQRLAVNPFTGEPEIDSAGRPVYEHESLLTSRNNFMYLGPVPVFYWPSFSTDLERPTFFVRNAQVQNDRIFGTWVSTELDAFQLFGIRNKPLGVDATLNLDYLTDRGFGGGGTLRYERPDLFGYGGRAAGAIDGWIINDRGRDNLGRTRQSLDPEEDIRYRLFANHRQDVFGDWQLTAETGLISDRNFLEQYYEWEWDQLKDQSTGLELKRTRENRSFAVSADVRVNDFFTQTEWLPRADHFWLGQPLFEDRLTWFEHTHVGFARLRTASTPLDPQDAAFFQPLSWEQNSTGVRAATRQEVDLPFDLGPFRVVPYALGEAGYWGEDLTGNDTTRLFGQAGVRASIPFWAVNPFIESDLFNVHGLAHKVTLEAEFSYSDADRNLDRLPLFDPLDDDAQEHFRRRLSFLTFGGTTPVRFDERFYALRSGLQNWVASPSAEIADDLMAIRLGLRQRWQTKRGPPQNRRIIDWITLDLQTALFPFADRDNFGETVGLAGYDFRWHVGDRLTILSDGSFDFFNAGQETYSIAALLTRPGRGNWYWGYRNIGGPVDSKVFSSSYSYRVSPKWIASVGTSYDLGENGNIGQNFGITRIGESFLTGVSVNVDAAKNNVGVTFLIEPRFAPRSRLGRVGGVPVPVAGLYGLE